MAWAGLGRIVSSRWQEEEEGEDEGEVEVER